jgi:hypothetical protein
MRLVDIAFCSLCPFLALARLLLTPSRLHVDIYSIAEDEGASAISRPIPGSRMSKHALVD